MGLPLLIEADAGMGGKTLPEPDACVARRARRGRASTMCETLVLNTIPALAGAASRVEQGQSHA